MDRHLLTDEQWNAIRVYLPPERSGDRGRPWCGHRITINGIFWVLATGSPWRDVPEKFGKWQTIYKRFRRWTLSGLWKRIWEGALARSDRQQGVDRSVWCVDGSIIRAHQSAVGGSRKIARNAEENALGKSRGGYSTKIHLACDTHGLPLGITITAGQVNEPTEFVKLMHSIPLSLHHKRKRPAAIAGDKAYVAGYIFEWIDKMQIENVIPNRRNENKNPHFDRKKYRLRNVIERLIGRLKQFRRIATRYEKTNHSYLAMLQLACLKITLKSI